ncbi:thrombospondin type 3 repeat-containing protein [Solirubrobacter taibaiensis]|nr:thrombospondin type 3 repeat-containing protein [Solirubrobacter taibaiensis]
MTFRQCIVVAAAGLAPLGFTADARAADPATHTIAPSVADPATTDTSPTRGNNLVWLAAPERRVGKLLVFLPLGGMLNIPTEFEEFGSEAGRLGYHTIVLAYRNEAPVAMAPPVGCGNGVEASTAPPNCAIDARMEILNGLEKSATVNVNRAGSIENRLNKLLVHLAATYPSEGWGQFIDTGGTEPTPKWSQTVIAGGSFGAGQAAIIAAEHEVHRAVLITGWTDAKHGWVKLGATPQNRFATLIHAREEFFARTCFAYVALGLAPVCPLAEFPVLPVVATNPALVENRPLPFGTRQLVFNIEPINQPPIANPYHPSPLRDGYLPREANGAPAQKLVNAWRSSLGDSDADTRLDQVDNCPLVANAEQVDSDANGTGDACGPTFAQGTVGGAVPATLALTLGTPATFGAFVPGVTRTYDATTTASVISTAGDAALTVSDPGHLTNGAFSLPEPLRVTLNPASWTAPVSNAAVSVAFTQLVKATDALRTGTYSKVLTFTLSTTTP